MSKAPSMGSCASRSRWRPRRARCHCIRLSGCRCRSAGERWACSCSVVTVRHWTGPNAGCCGPSVTSSRWCWNATGCCTPRPRRKPTVGPSTSAAPSWRRSPTTCAARWRRSKHPSPTCSARTPSMAPTTRAMPSTASTRKPTGSPRSSPTCWTCPASRVACSRHGRRTSTLPRSSRHAWTVSSASATSDRATGRPGGRVRRAGRPDVLGSRRGQPAGQRGQRGRCQRQPRDRGARRTRRWPYDRAHRRSRQRRPANRPRAALLPLLPADPAAPPARQWAGPGDQQGLPDPDARADLDRGDPGRRRDLRVLAPDRQHREMSKGRVLVVDDEQSIRRAVGRALAARGYKVQLATDGEEALTAAAAFQPDLVVLDLNLPALDGLQVCRQLRGWSQVPILVLSVREEEPDKVAALDLGADDYLTKPFGIDELMARVRALLRRASAQGGP